MAATVNLWSIEKGLCLAQRRISEASGEGPQCELLLRHLQLKGVILSGDAAYCQHRLASYVNALGVTMSSISKATSPRPKPKATPSSKPSPPAVPMIWSRPKKATDASKPDAAQVTGDVAGLACRGQWSGLTRITLCKRETLNLITGKVTIGQRFFVTSLQTDAGLIARSVRQH